MGVVGIRLTKKLVIRGLFKNTSHDVAIQTLLPVYNRERGKTRVTRGLLLLH